jgi:hypothetical protein
VFVNAAAASNGSVFLGVMAATQRNPTRSWALCIVFALSCSWLVFYLNIYAFLATTYEEENAEVNPTKLLQLQS